MDKKIYIKKIILILFCIIISVSSFEIMTAGFDKDLQIYKYVSFVIKSLYTMFNIGVVVAVVN